MKTTTSVKCSLQLNGERAILFAGKSYEPDQCTAYFDMYLSHAFPVVTKDRFAIHPQVVANSYHTMERKMLNLAHQIQAYDPDEPEDRILGSIVAVEFTVPGEAPGAAREARALPGTLPEGKWTVQGDRAKAPGIHALCSLWKAAKGAIDILGEHLTGKREWVVSQEVNFNYAECGFAVGKAESRSLKVEADDTPLDFAALGYTYVPMGEASAALLACYDFESGRMRYPWSEQNVILMVGGLDGNVRYAGAGLCRLGKEPEARVGRMVAGENGKQKAESRNPEGQVVEVLARALRAVTGNL